MRLLVGTAGGWGCCPGQREQSSPVLTKKDFSCRVGVLIGLPEEAGHAWA